MRIAARTEQAGQSGILPRALAETYRRGAFRAHEGLGPASGPDQAWLDLLRPSVRESWQRSLMHHGNPDISHAELVFDDAALPDYRAAHPLAAVMPVIRRLLIDPATDSGLLVAVGDELGRLLWVDGDDGLRRRAEGMLFVAGAEWSERTVGTSAPGTALATAADVQIAGPEHFSRQVHSWNCTAVPLRDPGTGQILGVVDVTGGPDAVAPNTLALIRAAVTAAESVLQIRALKEHLNSRPAGTAGQSLPQTTMPVEPPAAAAAAQLTTFRPLTGTAAQHGPAAAHGTAAAGRTTARSSELAGKDTLRVLGRDRAELILATGPGIRNFRTVELSARHSELLTVLALHPEGLTTEDLGLLAYPEGTPPGTVRAEMLRLRNFMSALSAASDDGGPPLRSQPAAAMATARATPGTATDDAGTGITKTGITKTGTVTDAGTAGTGALVPSSRPYRLPRTLRLDAQDVLEHMERGAFRQGLQLYRGPVLPRSDAPAVRDLRARVSAVLREAVLTGAGPETLLQYLQLPEAANDVEAWRLALRLLPARSPRRAAIVAAVERIERELA